MNDAAVIVIGSGPAGASAAKALVTRGIDVLMLDAGSGQAINKPPAGALADLVRSDDQQWKWRLGLNYEGLSETAGASPKTRIPSLVRLLAGYAARNRIVPDNFRMIGALGAGGLSNAWGCGVAKFSGSELGDLFDAADDMAVSYARVAEQMGLSGRSEDALKEYFGVDAWSEESLPPDTLRAYLWERRHRLPPDIRMGRPRLAVRRSGLSSCDLSGMCMWGCARKALWSANELLDSIKHSPHFKLMSGHLVTGVSPVDGGWRVEASLSGGETAVLQAPKVVLAAGTLATTRLAFSQLGFIPDYARLQSSPVAAFMMLTPSFFGSIPDERFFALGQLALTIEDPSSGETALAFLVSPLGFPISELVPYVPLPPRPALTMLRALLTSFTVGNVFFPGSLSDHKISLLDDGSLRVQGGHATALDGISSRVRGALGVGARRLGSVLVPSSFNIAEPGADIHYVGTLPAKKKPRFGECFLNGEMAGVQRGLYIADGASLSMLPAKSHTMTIMANADRIGRGMSAS